MKTIPNPIAISFLAATVFDAGTNELAIIPQPQKLELRAGVFKLTAATKIFANFSSVETANQPAARLRPAIGHLPGLSRTSGAIPINGGILLTTKNANPNLGAEGYEPGVNDRPDAGVENNISK